METTTKVLNDYLKKKDRESLLKAEARDDVRPIIDMLCAGSRECREERERIRAGIVLVPPTVLENLYKGLLMIIDEGGDSPAVRRAIESEWLYKEKKED